MRHIKRDREFIEKIYDEKVINVENEDLDTGYYHFYQYTEVNEDFEWDNYVKDSYYYPSGGLFWYKNGRCELVDRKSTVLTSKGLNPYQWMIVDALKRDRDEIEVLFLTGVAGSGKTYLSLAYALEMLDKENIYTNVVLSRPKQSLGREQGFLPGDEDDKIEPYMKPFYDNARSMGYIQRFERAVRKGEDVGGIIFQALETIKGRSFENSIVIIDEAEDLRYREIESLLTRVNRCKMIIAGDVAQVDDNIFSRNNIPLVYSIKKFRKDNIDFVIDIHNPINNRESKVVDYVIKNFSYEEFKEGVY